MVSPIPRTISDATDVAEALGVGRYMFGLTGSASCRTTLLSRPARLDGVSSIYAITLTIVAGGASGGDSACPCEFDGRIRRPNEASLLGKGDAAWNDTWTITRRWRENIGSDEIQRCALVRHQDSHALPEGHQLSGTVSSAASSRSRAKSRS